MNHGRINHRKNEPQHQHECLARYVLSLPTLEQRRMFLARWEGRHGTDSVDNLKTTMLEEVGR